MSNEQNKVLTLVAADDHQLFLEGLGSLFARVPNCRLVAVCGDGETLLQLVAAHRPDGVLLDISMPGPSSESIVTRIGREFPETRIIALTMHRDAGLAAGLFERGLAGYVSKDAAFDELGEAIEALRAGQRYRSPGLDELERVEVRAKGDDGLLSARELSVLRHAADGFTNQQIADALSISERTVRFHLNNCRRKLDAQGRAHAIARAIQLNLL